MVLQRPVELAALIGTFPVKNQRYILRVAHPYETAKQILSCLKQIARTDICGHAFFVVFLGDRGPAGQLKRLKQVNQENTRLRRAVADLTLDKMILKEAAQGNFLPS
jgi:putative transposase